MSICLHRSLFFIPFYHIESGLQFSFEISQAVLCANADNSISPSVVRSAPSVSSVVSSRHSNSLQASEDRKYRFAHGFIETPFLIKYEKEKDL